MLNASAEQLKALTACFTKAVCAIAGTAAKVKFTAPVGAGVDYSINGLMYHKADADNVWTLSGTTVADLSECIFLLCLNAAGTMSVVQGASILTADLASGKAVLRWPAAGESVCPIGAVRVTTDGAAFIPGTTALSAGMVTDTYYDFSVLPAAPLTS